MKKLILAATVVLGLSACTEQRDPCLQATDVRQCEATTAAAAQTQNNSLLQYMMLSHLLSGTAYHTSAYAAAPAVAHTTIVNKTVVNKTVINKAPAAVAPAPKVTTVAAKPVTSGFSWTPSRPSSSSWSPAPSRPSYSSSVSYGSSFRSSSFSSGMRK